MWHFKRKKWAHDCTFLPACVQLHHDTLSHRPHPTQSCGTTRAAPGGLFSQLLDMAALVMCSLGAYLNAFCMISPVTPCSKTANCLTPLRSSLAAVNFGFGFIVLRLSSTVKVSQPLVTRPPTSRDLIIRRFMYCLAPLGFALAGPLPFHFLTGRYPHSGLNLHNDSGLSWASQLATFPVCRRIARPIQAIFLIWGFCSLLVAFRFAVSH